MAAHRQIQTPTTREPSAEPVTGAWKLEDAKARFSEVVRRACSEGPQRVTVRGREAVVVMSVEDLQALSPPNPDRPAFLDFMEGLGLHGLDQRRSRDTGRNVVL